MHYFILSFIVVLLVDTLSGIITALYCYSQGHSRGMAKLRLRYMYRLHIHTYIHIYNIYIYLTIIPRARMGCESIAHEAEGRMSY